MKLISLFAESIIKCRMKAEHHSSFGTKCSQMLNRTSTLIFIAGREGGREGERDLRTVANIRKHHKVFHRVETFKGSSKLNGLPWILVSPCYQNRTLTERTDNERSYYVSSQSLSFDRWQWAPHSFWDCRWQMNRPSLAAVVLLEVDHLSNKWIQERHQQHRARVPVEGSSELIHQSLERCHGSTVTKFIKSTQLSEKDEAKCFYSALHGLAIWTFLPGKGYLSQTLVSQQNWRRISLPLYFCHNSNSLQKFKMLSKSLKLPRRDNKFHLSKFWNDLIRGLPYHGCFLIWSIRREMFRMTIPLHICGCITAAWRPTTPAIRWIAEWMSENIY